MPSPEPVEGPIGAPGAPATQGLRLAPCCGEAAGRLDPRRRAVTAGGPAMEAITVEPTRAGSARLGDVPGPSLGNGPMPAELAEA